VAKIMEIKRQKQVRKKDSDRIMFIFVQE